MATSVRGSSLSSTVRTNEAGEPFAYVSNSFRFTDSEKETILPAIKRAGIDPLEGLLVPIDQLIERSACMISILNSEDTRSNVTAEIGFVYGKYETKKPIFALRTDPAFALNVANLQVVSYIKQSGGALFTGHNAMQDWERSLKEWADNWKKTHSV